MKAQIESPYLNTAEALSYLKVCRKTLHNWIGKGIITAYKIGNTNRFKRTELDAALRPVKPLT
ncbi:helix-turn-helix domain-containing protein [Marinifilum sp.]|uniref:helix-turn-helix domain-containing protein n=1 Tax=Marinifilum sp. TaxID=2033137 RepID=UPI003BAA8390